MRPQKGTVMTFKFGAMSKSRVIFPSQTLSSLSILLSVTLILMTQLTQSNALDCETGWTPYKDEKCLKLIDQFVTQEDAEALCLVQVGGRDRRVDSPTDDDDDNIPPLLTIKTAEEQEWATKFVFESSLVVDNAWLGAKRAGVDLPFLWSDGSALSYTNWHEGYPSQVEGNECTQMVPKGALEKISKTDFMTKDAVDGKWTDIGCTRRNLVVCQKLQTWSLRKLQRISLETTKALVETTKALTDLQNNPVPMGFIYVQLPRQPAVNETWPNVEWKDVTGEYAGLFFRAEGGQAAPFDSVQEQSVWRMLRALYAARNSSPWYDDIIVLPKNGWSVLVNVGFLSTSLSQQEGLRFEMADAETRPVNTAVRIWKRVA